MFHSNILLLSSGQKYTEGAGSMLLQHISTPSPPPTRQEDIITQKTNKSSPRKPQSSFMYKDSKLSDTASAEGIIMFTSYEALHPFWNYMSIPWEEDHSILKSSQYQYQFRTSLPANLQGISFVAKIDLVLRRVVFTMATVYLQSPRITLGHRASYAKMSVIRYEGT
jgi:hypothetical protein